MIPFGRMVAAGFAGLGVSLVVAAVTAFFLLASALGHLGDSTGEGGNGDDNQAVIFVLVMLIVGIGACAVTIRLSLGHLARGRRLMTLVSGGALFIGTIALLGGSIVIGHAITGGAGALWLPLGLIAAVAYLHAWASATIRLAPAR